MVLIMAPFASFLYLCSFETGICMQGHKNGLRVFEHHEDDDNRKNGKKGKAAMNITKNAS